MPYPARPPSFHRPNNQILKLLIMYSSLAFQHILLSTLVSNTRCRCSLSVRDRVSHPNITTDKITVLCNLISKVLARRREDKTLWTEWKQTFTVFHLPRQMLVCRKPLLFSCFVANPRVWVCRWSQWPSVYRLRVRILVGVVTLSHCHVSDMTPKWATVMNATVIAFARQKKCWYKNKCRRN
jgi:hypothetical protein